MFCAIYRSNKRDRTYLYVEKKDDFTHVPEELMKSFGKPEFSMVLNLATREKLAQADIEKVKAALIDPGYYLQVPPPTESLLNIHLESGKK